MATQRAIVVKQPGGPEVLILDPSYLKPSVEPGKLLVHIRAFGLNRAELVTRSGGSGDAVQFPKVIGIEAVGTVEEVGPGLEGKGWKKGDVVCCAMGKMGRSFDGGYQEYAVLPLLSVSPPLNVIPSGLDWSTLVAIPETYLTAHGALTASLGLQQGHTLLIRGASSAAGLAAASLAKHVLGAGTVVGTTRDKAKVERIRAAGCDFVFLDGDRGAMPADPSLSPSKRSVSIPTGADVPLSKRIRGPASPLPSSVRGIASETGDPLHGVTSHVLESDAATGYGPTNGGFDAVLDFVGTTTLLDSLKCAKSPGGTVCLLGGLAGGWNLGSFTPLGAIPSGVKLTTFSSYSHSIAHLPLATLLPLIGSPTHPLSVHLDRVFKMEDIQDAHRYMEANEAKGKIVVLTGTDGPVHPDR